MNADRKYRSQLFTLRLWTEPGMSRLSEVRFKVQHVRSGEVRYFREWSALVEFVLAIAEDDDTLHCHDFSTERSNHVTDEQQRFCSNH